MNNNKRRKIIGRTSATERDPNTADKFNFWIAGGGIVNPFDIVEAEHFNNSRTIGLVTGLEYRTDAFSHLTNYVSNNFGSVEEEPNTPRVGATMAKINVMMNDGGGKKEDGIQKNGIYMPVENEKSVYFSEEEGIHLALGINTIEEKNRIPAGLIKMSNEVEAVVYLDSDWLIGPESAHLNISGVSGLATKTSYAMFILQSLLQTLDSKEIAVIILNLKHGDLLQIDQPPDRLDESQKAIWTKLGVEPKPFENVHYLLPRAKDGRPNSHIIPTKDFKKFAYSLEDSVDKLDILFSGVPDKADTIDSLVGEISDGYGTNKFSHVNDWNSLLNGPPLVDIDTGKSQKIGDVFASSVGKFRRHLRRIVQTRTSGIFTKQRTRDECHLSEEIRGIEGGHTYVVDIAKLRDNEQSFVFGDIINTIYKMFAESDGTYNLPQKVIIFVDELNKYAPSGAKESPLIEQLLDISERGRSLGVILFSAEQFMSAVHPRITGNCSTHVFGRTSSSEVMLPDYRFLEDLKLSLTRLTKGELLLRHAPFRQPVKIIFPKPAYKQDW